MKVCTKCNECLITKQSIVNYCCDGCFFKSKRTKEEHSSKYFEYKHKALSTLTGGGDINLREKDIT